MSCLLGPLQSSAGGHLWVGERAAHTGTGTPEVTNLKGEGKHRERSGDEHTFQKHPQIELVIRIRRREKKQQHANPHRGWQVFQGREPRARPQEMYS